MKIIKSYLVVWLFSSFFLLTSQNTILASHDEATPSSQCIIDTDLNLLSKTVNVGDYIAYDAGVWDKTLTVDDMKTNERYQTFGGYVSGVSRNQGINCETGEPITDRYGWRVAKIDGDAVILIADGTPLCYYSTYGAAATAVNIANIQNKIYNGDFLNTNLATNSGVLDKELADEIYGGTLVHGSTIQSLTSVLNGGAKYWLPSISTGNANHLVVVQPTAYGSSITSFGAAVYGVKPIVYLKNTIYIDNGDGSKDNPYQIKDLGPSTVPQRNLTGYWTNWNALHADPSEDISVNLRVREVPAYYDNVILFGALPYPDDPSTYYFELDQYLGNRLNYTQEEMIADIALLKQRGQRPLISIISVGDNKIEIETSQQVDNFVNSMIGIVEDFGFMGIDVDIEHEVNYANLEIAIRRIKEHFGEDFFITWIVEQPDFRLDRYGNKLGRYRNTVVALKDIIDVVHVSNYNAGSLYALDGTVYEPATIDFAVNSAAILIEGGLNEDQVGIGFTTWPEQRGYMDAQTVDDAYQMLRTGITSQNANTVLPRAYPNFNAMMTWNINMDNFNHEKHGQLLSGTMPSYDYNNLNDLDKNGLPSNMATNILKPVCPNNEVDCAENEQIFVLNGTLKPDLKCNRDLRVCLQIDGITSNPYCTIVRSNKESDVSYTFIIPINEFSKTKDVFIGGILSTTGPIKSDLKKDINIIFHLQRSYSSMKQGAESKNYVRTNNSNYN